MTESNRGRIANRLVELHVGHLELIQLIPGHNVPGIKDGKKELMGPNNSIPNSEQFLRTCLW